MRKPFLNYLAFLLLFSTALSAQTPKTMSYQGVLADTSGNAVADGNYNLTFKIYDIANGGSEIWTETQTIPVVDGIFNAILGSTTPLNLAFDKPYWLGVAVDGGTELSPRIELTSAPYSLEPDSGSGGSGDGHSLDAADGDPVDAVFVDNDGKVGVGITNPSAALDVRGVGPDNGVIFNIGNSDATHFLRLFGGRQNDPNPFIQWKAGDPLRFSTDANGFTELMRISGNGTVGIGTSTPFSNSKLHVESHSRYAGYFTSDYFSFPPANTHVLHAEYADSSNNDAIAVYGRSVPSPDWGIGGTFEGGYRGLTSSATIPGSLSRTGVWSSASNGSFNYGIWGEAFNGITSYGVYGMASGGSSNSYSVYAAGDLAYTGNLINASDAGLKQNIRPLTGSLNKLLQLKPKLFNYTSDKQYAHMNLPTGEHYGLIAQEVEQVLPELVSNNSHPSAAESRGEKSDDPPITYKGLNYMELIPILIEAIKEQQQEIESLKAEVNSLKNR